jgi:hypothetical protein
VARKSRQTSGQITEGLYPRQRLVYSLLGLRDQEAILGLPITGASGEGFVIEALIGVAPAETTASFYRTSAGAEIDLLLALPNGDIWAVEVKRSLSPTLEKGFTRRVKT